MLQHIREAAIRLGPLPGFLDVLQRDEESRLWATPRGGATSTRTLPEGGGTRRRQVVIFLKGADVFVGVAAKVGPEGALQAVLLPCRDLDAAEPRRVISWEVYYEERDTG